MKTNKKINGYGTVYNLNQDYFCFILINSTKKFKANKKPFRIQKTEKGWRFFTSELTSRWERNLDVTNMYKQGVYVFETEQEAIEAYDELLLSFAENAETERREKIYKNLIQTPIPNLKSEEARAIRWYKNLSKEEKEFVHFLKYKYSKI